MDSTKERAQAGAGYTFFPSKDTIRGWVEGSSSQKICLNERIK